MASTDEYKQFLTTNGWVNTHIAVIKQVMDEYKAKNPGKACPSLGFVLATITQESGGQTWAVRYEPNFFKWLTGRITEEPSILKVFGNSISRATEVKLRSSSFGLMQVMGQTLRELGFTGQYLNEACDPRIGLAFGIKYLARLLDKYKDERAAMAAFNAGSPRKDASGKYFNQEYVDGVSKFKEKWDFIIDKGWI